MATAVPQTPRESPPFVQVQRRRPRRSLAAPRLSVVIVNYGPWDDTAALVRQLAASPAVKRGAVEIVIVDNHAPADPLVRKLRRWPGVSLRRWGRNRGFGRAANEGCRLSRGAWLLLLNPDTSVSPNFLQDVLRYAETLPDNHMGIVGFQLRNSDGSKQHSCGPEPTLVSTFARLLLPRARRKYRPLSSRRRRRVPWVTGCGLLLRRDCFQDLGGFDEDYFLYYEDVDLCRRATAQGWSVWYEPELRLVHHRPLHARTVPAHLRLLTRHALLTYAAKHWPRWQARLLAGIVRMEAHGRRWLASRRRDLAAAELFEQLGALAAEFGRGDFVSARLRLRQLVRREERQRVA